MCDPDKNKEWLEDKAVTMHGDFAAYYTVNLSENKDGWRKELTYISWNNRAPKFDLRSWDPDYQAMTKGITMTKEELEKLRDVLNEMDFDKY